MKTLTICGSMRFEAQMRQIAFQLEVQQGYNVLQCVYGDGGALTPAQRQSLVAAHYRKIDLSDGIYVVNPGGYIGESVRSEIAYAKEKGKEILFYEESENAN